ncbi:IPTL-CTERM sorting domain-containing protein [Brevundimonas staleyi]|uniref:IPTL-CTERM sorting domain-containing protein n=1 Tax=Brevundimonas staleyi TaxID=74326 RepID=A0ABW0FQZ3_9CAUL
MNGFHSIGKGSGMAFRARTGAIAAAVLLAMGSPVLAADIDYTTGVVVNCESADDSNATGQIFTIPAGETLLKSVSLGLSADGGFSSGTLTLHPVSGGTISPSVLGTANFTTTTDYPNFVLETLTFPGGGMAVSGGQTYAILALTEPGGYVCVAAQADVYNQGVLSVGGVDKPNEDALFAARFVSPAPVPTLSEWAMILLGLMLAGGAVVIQRRRMAA